MRRVASGLALLLLVVVTLPRSHPESPRVVASLGPVSPVRVVEIDPTTTTTVAAMLPPTPVRPPVRAGGGSGGAPSGPVEETIARYFPDVPAKAVAVARCESSLNPSAVSSGGGNWGLFQINTVHRDDFESYTGHPWSDVLDAEWNTMYARKLYESLGWGPWACKGAA